eukprot:scaffold86940_cov63-Phaeocystis_antarctica.AAC.3
MRVERVVDTRHPPVNIIWGRTPSHSLPLLICTFTPHTTRTCVHIDTGVRQTGHSFIWAEQTAQAHW